MKHLILPFFVYILSAMTCVAQQARYHKLSPMLRQLVAGQKNRAVEGKDVFPNSRNMRKVNGGKEPEVCAFVRIMGDGKHILAENGCRELAHVGNIYIASIPVGRLAALSLEKAVDRIEARRGTHALMDSMAVHLNALPVYEGTALPQAYTGKDVVMGIMDIGFDLTHPNFYDARAENYRICRLWDHITPDTAGSSLYVGRDYTTKSELLSLGCSYDGKVQTHGTHTLGIAAGSGYGSPYRGMAPESDICLVANVVSEDTVFIDPADYYKYTYATDALGFKYIFDYAEQQGKPCVISFSEGSEQDFFGYDILYYEMLDNLVGPGRILVASAGNNGGVMNYLRKERGRDHAGTFMSTSSGRVSLTAKADAPFVLRTVVYGGERDTILIPSRHVTDTQDSCLVEVFTACGKDYHFTITAYPSCYVPTETCYDIEVRTSGRMGYDTPVSFEFVGKEAEVEVFRGAGTMGTNQVNPELDDAVSTHTIHSPASAPSVICVGATGYRTRFVNYLGEQRIYDQGNDGRRSAYSSVGPTYDGRIKPDVMAPGANIISSYSSYYLESNPTARDILSDVEHFDFRGRTYSWNSNAGTSMSTPAVGGAIALWLQAKPTLTPDEVMQVIARTSWHYDESLTYPNNLYGYGQIDVYRGLLDILGIDGISGLSADQPKAVRFENEGKNRIGICFAKPTSFDFSIRVYSVNGVQMMTQSFPHGSDRYQIDLSAWPDGVYAIQIDSRQPDCTGSTLVRK